MHFKLPFKSIAQKVLLALAVTIVLVMSISGIIYYAAEKDKAVRQLHQKAAQTSERLSNSLIYPLWNVSTTEIVKTIDLEMADKDIVAIVLYDEFNHFLIGKIEDERGRIKDYSSPEKVSIEIKDAPLVVVKKIFKGAEYLGEVRLYFTNRNLNQYLWNLAWEIILLTILVSFFAIIIIYYTLHRIVLTPIMALQEITNRLRYVVGGGLSGDDKTSISDGDEIELLGHNFTVMADELTTAQESLRHTAEHLQALLDETPDAVVTMDGNGKIINVNKTFLQMFTGSAEELIGISFSELAAEADLKKRIPGYLVQALLGKHVELESRLMRKTGEIFPVLIRIGIMHSGNELLLLAVMTDITERKQAEEAHYESESKYRRLVDNLGREYFFYIHNTQGIMTYVSPSVHDMVGYTQDEFLTHYSAYLTDNPINREVVEKTNLALQGLKQEPYLIEIYAKSGYPLWLEVSESPVIDRNGRVVALEGIAHDITAKRAAQEALQESEKRFRSLFEKSADAFLLIENGEYTDCNQSAVDMLRASSKEEIIHRKPVDISPVYQPDGQLSTDKAALFSAKVMSEGSHRFEWTHRRLDGEEFPAEVLLTLIPSGKRNLIHVVWRDITGRKAAEEALRTSESRMRAISDNLRGGMIYQVVFSPDGTRRFNYLSGSIEKMHEITAEEVIKDPSILYNQIVEEDRPRLIEEEDRCIREMQTFNIEARSLLPSGLVRWMKITSQPRRLPTGEIVFDGVEMDITDLKQAESQISESLGLLQATLESTSSGILVTDLEQRIVNYNHRFVDMWQIPAEILFSRKDEPVLRFVLDQLSDPESFHKGVQHLYANKAEESIDIIDFKDRRIFERYSIPTYRGSDIVGRVWSFKDITAQKQAEQSLRESEERFSRAFNSSPAPMAISEIETGLFIDANERWLALTGYSKEELIGHTAIELKMHVDPGLREQMVNRLRQKGYFKEVDMCIRIKNGKYVNALWSAEIISLGGRDVMLTLLIDVTERKLAEKRILESLGLLQATLESAADGILVTDLDAHIVNYNRRFLELWKIPPEILTAGGNHAMLKTVLAQLKEPETFLEGMRHLYSHPAIEQHDVTRFLDGRVFERFSIPTYRGDEIVGRVWSFRDVTETRRAGEALRSSEAKYRRLHESMTDAFASVDMTGRLVEVNRSFEEMVGYTQDELIHLSYLQLTPARWHAREAEIVETQVLTRGYSDIYEKEYIHKDGTIFPIELRSYLIRTDEGQPIGIWAIVRDITARKQAEEALRENEALFRSQFEYGNIGIAITSVEKGWLRVNKRLCDMLGYTEEEMYVKNWSGMTHPDDLANDMAQYNRMLAGEIEAYEMDKRFFRKDGSIIHTHLTVSCFRNPDRTVRFVIASVLDISETALFIEKLSASETTIRALLNATADALFVTDMEGIILGSNTTLAERFGKTTEEIQGTNIYSYLPLQLAEDRRKKIQTVIESGQPLHFVDNRKGLWLENTFYPIFNSSGQISMLAAYSRDITLRKQAEEKLEESLEFNRKIVSSSAVGIVVFSEAGQCISANDAAAMILGLPVDHLLEQNFNNIESWKQSGLVERANRVLNDKTMEITEVRMKTSAEKEIWITCYLNWFINVGKPHLLILVVDNTESKQAEMELLRYREHLEDLVKQRTSALSEANANLTRFRRFAETSGQGFGMASLDGKIVYANATLRHLIGSADIDEGISLSFLDRYPEEFQKKLQEEILPQVLRDEQWIGELALVDTEGNTFPTIENYFLIRDETGNPALIADVVTDIREIKRTERELKQYRDHLEDLVKQRTRELQKLNEDLQNEIFTRLNTEKALRESEQRYRTLFENAPIGITVMKPDRTFEYVNPRFTEMLGYTLSDIPDKNTWFKKAYPNPEYRRYVINLWKDDLSGHRLGERTLKVRTKTRQERVIHFRTAILDNGDHLMSYEDVTELQALNDALRSEISERQHVEEALRASEQRYRTLFENAPVGISLMKANREIVYINPQFTKMFGYTLADLPNKDTWFLKAYPDPEYRRHIISLWEKDLYKSQKEDRHGEITLKVRTKDGTTRVIRIHTAVQDDGDHLVSYEDITNLQELNEALLKEISERTQAEEALRTSEERYRTLFESAPVGICVTSLNGRLIAANEGLLDMLRAPSREEAFKIDLANIYIDPEERQKLLERVQREGVVHNYETKMKTMDGSIRDTLLTINRFNYAEDEAFLSVLQDITWRKEAEEETRHLKNYLANIIDSMPSILVGVDKYGMVTQWNTSAQQHTGISFGNAQGQPIETCLPLLSDHTHLIHQAILNNSSQTFPRLQTSRDGEIRFLDTTVYPLTTNGVEGAVVRIDDVTERVRIEEMMIQSEKMLSVGGLAAGMAHEINNPLGIIMAGIHNIQRRLSPDLQTNVTTAVTVGTTIQAIHEYMEKRQLLLFLNDMQEGVNRASQIVTSMLSFSRKPQAESGQENLAALLDKTISLASSDYDLRKKYDFRQINILREYDPATPEVLCQAGKIQQVFLNILRNGAEAMAENRTEGHLPQFTLRVRPDGKWVRIEIEDNGPGMEEAVRRRIFEPFYTTKAQGAGTGLGLSVSYFIITENHGGMISVETTPGAGARFIIRLPINKEYLS
jgi:PAS domain S-box-containing protein